MTTFRLPDLGEGLSEAELVAWHVDVGERVVADQPLVSVETDKAVVEVPAPQAGRIAARFGEAGDIVKIGAPLVEFADARRPDSGTVVGRVPEGPPRPPPSGTEPPPSGTEPRAAPAVRALARRLGIELAEVAGSGPDGQILSRDIEAAAGSGEGEGRTEPLRGVRRAMARNMADSHARIVPATVNDLADISDWRSRGDITLRLIRAIVTGCAREPALNAWFLGLDKGRRLHAKVSLGIAVDSPDGLFVPVMRDVGSRDPADLRRGLEAMKADLRARSVPLAELRGATITLSNFGMFGGQHAALVILAPQVAIIGAGRVHESVLPVSGVPAVRRVLPLSLTFDHRAVMGGEASRFLAAVIGDLQQSE